jgi:hypothetical protein
VQRLAQREKGKIQSHFWNPLPLGEGRVRGFERIFRHFLSEWATIILCFDKLNMRIEEVFSLSLLKAKTIRSLSTSIALLEAASLLASRQHPPAQNTYPQEEFAHPIKHAESRLIAGL